MNRVINNDLINSTAPAESTNGRGAASTSQTNQNSTNATVAGQATTNSAGQVTSAYDATRYGNG